MTQRKGRRRNKTQKAKQLKEAASLREKGHSLRDIAKEIDLSFKQVQRDLQEIEAALIEDAKDSMEEYRKQILAKLRNTQIQSYKGWLKSLQDKEKHSEKMSEKGMEHTSSTEAQSGNPSHMANMIKAIEAEAKMLGVYNEATDENENSDKLINGLTSLVNKARDYYES
jgi:transcriptional antiterminator